MRLTPALCAAAIILGTVSTASVSAPTTRPLAPLSVAAVAEGQRLQAARSLDEAAGYYETALAADPRNTRAFIGLAEIARAQSLPGKAVAFYREALALEPGNRAALAGQGEALAQRGAIGRARTALAAVRAACGTAACPDADRLAAAIDAGARTAAVRPQAVLPAQVAAPAPSDN